MADQFDELTLLLGCPRCGAKAGAWCRTKSGGRATFLHAPRGAVVWQAWRAGSESGRVNELEFLTQAIEYRRQGNRWARDVPLAGLDVLGWLQQRLERATSG